eukprot:1159183-Pelagomonas_calceolata.AAC.7
MHPCDLCNVSNPSLPPCRASSPSRRTPAATAPSLAALPARAPSAAALCDSACSCSLPCTSSGSSGQLLITSPAAVCRCPCTATRRRAAMRGGSGRQPSRDSPHSAAHTCTASRPGRAEPAAGADNSGATAVTAAVGGDSNTTAAVTPVAAATAAYADLLAPSAARMHDARHPSHSERQLMRRHCPQQSC